MTEKAGEEQQKAAKRAASSLGGERWLRLTRNRYPRLLRPLAVCITTDGGGGKACVA
jgi:hypothetical protein